MQFECRYDAEDTGDNAAVSVVNPMTYAKIVEYQIPGMGSPCRYLKVF